MNGKVISILCVCAALIGAAVSAIVVTTNRAKVARFKSEAAALALDKAEAEAKRASKEKDAETERRRAADAKAKMAADEVARAKIEKETEALALKTAEENRKAKEAEAKAAKERNAEADAKRAAEVAKAKAAASAREQAQHDAAAAQAKAQEAADRLAAEKLKSEKTVADAKLLELRRIDFQDLERKFSEWQADLEERERALQPEKTIADLAWAGGMEDSVMDAEGNVVKQRKEKYDVEKDLDQPVPTRHLARTQRVLREQFDVHAEATRERIILMLERLYTDAIRSGDVIQRDYYKQTLLALYPDWVYGGVTNLVAAQAAGTTDKEKK